MLRVLLVLLYTVFAIASFERETSDEFYSKSFQESDESNELNERGDIFAQTVDHFDATNTRKFYQRYYYNADYLKKNREKQIVLLFVGTGGRLDADYVKRGFLLEIAKELNALVVALESRHYGKSLTAAEYDTRELSTHTTQQALSDIITFRWHIRRKFSLKHDEWITVGGSTAGMLSAWARIKFPHFVKASIASSAPVKAEVQFKEYNENIAEAFSRESVGGSATCRDNIDQAFKAVDAALSSKAATAVLEKRLSSCKRTTDYKDLQHFVENLALPFTLAVINDGQREDLNIRKVCEMMTTESKPIDMLASVVSHFLQIINQRCMPADYDGYLQKLKSTMPSSFKSWYYQKCREFGFFQTCESNGCIFSKLMTPSYFTDICVNAYKITDQDISANSRFTNDYYGAEHPGGSRIIYTHGTLDPWRSLFVSESNAEAEIYSIQMNDVSHCRDLHIAEDTDSSEVTKARQFILRTLKKWFA